MHGYESGAGHRGSKRLELGAQSAGMQAIGGIQGMSQRRVQLQLASSPEPEGA